MKLWAILDVLNEAADPLTPGSRLAELAEHPREEVRQMARRNASLPESSHLTLVLGGDPDAWSSPLTTFVLMSLVSDPKLHQGARSCAVELTRAPRQDLAQELQTMLVPALQDWWSHDQNATELVRYVGQMALAEGSERAMHRQLVQVAALVLERMADMGGRWETRMDHARQVLAKWLAQKSINSDREYQALFSDFVQATEPPPQTVAAFALQAAYSAVSLTSRGFNVMSADAMMDHAASAYEQFLGGDTWNAKSAFLAEIAMALRETQANVPMPRLLLLGQLVPSEQEPVPVLEPSRPSPPRRPDKRRR